MPRVSQENMAQFRADFIQKVFRSRWARAPRMNAKGMANPT